MGSVWIAEHRALGTEVAVKFLSRELLQNETMRARFASEAAAASQVKSSHVVKIYDHGVTDTEAPFIVMELLEGEDLGTLIRTQGKLAPELVALVVTQLCKALQASHDKNVIHRDVKPENVFLTREDGDVFVKLLDFGVAKNDSVTEMTLKRTTMAGEALGTPYYMSPEQFRSSKGIDRRADLWSVGVVVYEALTGHVPFDAENLTSLAIVVNEARVQPPTEVDPELPKPLDAWVAKALARDPADRFQSARDLAEALRAALSLGPGTQPSLPDSSQRVVVHSGDMDKDISLRETAFASTGANVRPRSRLPIVLGGGVVAAVVAVIIVATRTTASPESHATGSPRASISAESPPIAFGAALLSVDTTSPSAIPIESLPTASATPKPEPTRHVQTATTTSAATASSTKPSHDQIW